MMSVFDTLLVVRLCFELLLWCSVVTPLPLFMRHKKICGGCWSDSVVVSRNQRPPMIHRYFSRTAVRRTIRCGRGVYGLALGPHAVSESPHSSASSESSIGRSSRKHFLCSNRRFQSPCHAAPLARAVPIGGMNCQQWTQSRAVDTNERAACTVSS